MIYNEAIRDKYLKHAVNIDKLGNNLKGKYVRLLSEVREEIFAKLKSENLVGGRATKKRLKDFLIASELAVNKKYKIFSELLYDDLEDIARVEAIIADSLLTEKINIYNNYYTNFNTKVRHDILNKEMQLWNNLRDFDILNYSSSLGTIENRINADYKDGLAKVRSPSYNETKYIHEYKKRHLSYINGELSNRDLYEDMLTHGKYLLNKSSRFTLDRDLDMFTIADINSFTKINDNFYIDSGKTPFNIMSSDKNVIEQRLNSLSKRDASFKTNYVILKHKLKKGSVALPSYGFNVGDSYTSLKSTWLIPNVDTLNFKGLEDLRQKKQMWVADHDAIKNKFNNRNKTGTQVKKSGQYSVIEVQKLNRVKVDSLSKAKIDISTSILDIKQNTTFIKNVVNNTIVGGSPARKWLGKQNKSLVAKFKRELQKGLLQGEALPSLVRRIRGRYTGKRVGYKDRNGRQRYTSQFKGGILDVSTRDANALVRSSIQAVTQKTRFQLYEQNSDLINGMQVLSTLDGRTSKICISLSGLAWDMEGNPLGHSKKYIGHPPFHWNCRSTFIPILKSWEDLIGDTSGLTKKQKNKLRKQDLNKSTQSSMDGQVASDIDYPTWMKSRSFSEQVDILGISRAKLLRDGIISARQLTDSKGAVLSVKDLFRINGKGSNFTDTLSKSDKTVFDPDHLSHSAYNDLAYPKRYSKQQLNTFSDFVEKDRLNNLLNANYVNEKVFSVKSGLFTRKDIVDIKRLDDLMYPSKDDLYLYKTVSLSKDQLKSIRNGKRFDLGTEFTKLNSNQLPALEDFNKLVRAETNSLKDKGRSLNDTVALLKIRLKKGQNAGQFGDILTSLKRRDMVDLDTVNRLIDNQPVTLPRNTNFIIKDISNIDFKGEKHFVTKSNKKFAQNLEKTVENYNQVSSLVEKQNNILNIIVDIE